MSEKQRILDYLDSEFTEPIRDTLWRNINLTPGMMVLVQHPQFQKLGRIKQLGPAFLVYPGATHTRFIHSLGVFSIAKRIIHSLLHHPNCPALSMEGVKGFLAASLLHDLGHFPFAHSLKELPLKTHETLTAELILNTDLSSILRDRVKTDPQFVAAVIDLSIEAGDNPEILFFRKLLSGVLDPDKLDYLNRDAFFCGVPYGVQDIDFIIDRIEPHPDSGMSINLQGLHAVENMLFSKYLMYRTVYWHRTVRIATAMIKKPLFSAVSEGIIKPEDLYHLDDDDFFSSFSRDDFAYSGIISDVFNRRLFKTVYECDFDQRNSSHQGMTDLSLRLKAEEELLRLIAPNHSKCGLNPVIIDIPEPISFEIELPIVIQDNYIPFMESKSVFSIPVVEGFTRSLRMIRVMVPPKLIQEGVSQKIEEFFG